MTLTLPAHLTSLNAQAHSSWEDIKHLIVKIKSQKPEKLITKAISITRANSSYTKIEEIKQPIKLFIKDKKIK
jgi:hypothetical protein